ncbi:hypothetical protein ASF49_20490 [Methylobacterium sp. Leaf104]|uniref:hypothetical protein n=1 Tax=Methylobacterium TaxID=407 RepID=UPI0006FC2B01|nr:MULTISPECIES: hypothetical protein [Methylobacterium]KQP40594.1 hypothetical protein ASF49_20490 [Methylobacterium sp. Leaf104]MCI9882715.1 hypothetical protein [Methylobacterium goesingense]
MARHRSPPVVLLWLAGALAAGAAERTPPHLCPENAPEGVRLPRRPGCGTARARPAASDAQGFRDLGGVTLRVGGRVSAEYGTGR